MTPTTTLYYHLAYAAVTLLYGGYTLSLWRRARRVREQIAQLSAQPSGTGTSR